MKYIIYVRNSRTETSKPTAFEYTDKVQASKHAEFLNEQTVRANKVHLLYYVKAVYRG